MTLTHIKHIVMLDQVQMTMRTSACLQLATTLAVTYGTWTVPAEFLFYFLSAPVPR